MKILHVVTVITPDGAFGGPVTVAVNQARALFDRGHDVVLTGGISGFSDIPNEINGVPSQLCRVRRLVPGIGFAGLWAPRLGSVLRRHRADIDVLHVHLTRDFVTLPAAWWAARHGIPLVLQCHSMVDASKRLLAKPLDAVWTLPTLRRAGRVFYLTELERQRLVEFGGRGLALEGLHNGVPVPFPTRQSTDVTSSTETERPEVLFLARLHPQKRPTLFAEVAARMLQAGSPADFTIIGPDVGEGTAVDAVIGALGEGTRRRIRRIPAIPAQDVAARLARAAVYVLPSTNETYPMSVLEAMSVARPVIVTNTCGLAPMVEEYRCGIVIDDSPEQLRSAMECLIGNQDEARAMGGRGRHAVERRFCIESVIDQVEDAYRQLSRARSHSCQ